MDREKSLPLLLHPLRIADTDQNTEPLLTRRGEEGSGPTYNLVALGSDLRDRKQALH